MIAAQTIFYIKTSSIESISTFTCRHSNNADQYAPVHKMIGTFAASLNTKTDFLILPEVQRTVFMRSTFQIFKIILFERMSSPVASFCYVMLLTLSRNLN